MLTFLAMTACTPKMTATPTTQPATEPTATPAETQIPTVVSPTDAGPSSEVKQYTNSAFGIGFQYPSNWFGPDEYVSDQTLRVAVGSDVVIPYGGEAPAAPSEVTNSYLVVVQYSKNSQDQSWNDTYASLLTLKDGESISGTRGLIIRVKQLNLGRFTGFEFISTLSETAQTDHVYTRNVILMDDQSNLLTVFGTPNNVEIPSGADWREVFQSIDAANLAVFDEIINSLTIE